MIHKKPLPEYLTWMYFPEASRLLLTCMALIIQRNFCSLLLVALWPLEAYRNHERALRSITLNLVQKNMLIKNYFPSIKNLRKTLILAIYFLFRIFSSSRCCVQNILHEKRRFFGFWKCDYFLLSNSSSF